LRALRDERAAALQPVDPDLARVAWRELGALVDKLAAGEPYRLTARRAAAGAPAALISGSLPVRKFAFGRADTWFRVDRG